MALSQGGRLLACINEPLQTDPDYSMTQDEMENLATVQRCMNGVDASKNNNSTNKQRNRFSQICFFISLRLLQTPGSVGRNPNGV